MQNLDNGDKKCIVDLAAAVVDELRVTFRFLRDPTTHDDWKELVADMPTELRSALNAIEQADAACKETSQACYLAEDRCQAAEAKLEKAQNQGASLPDLRKLQAHLEQTKTDLDAAQRASTAAFVAWQAIGTGPEFQRISRRVAAYENQKKELWLSERRQRLRERLSALKSVTADHRQYLEGHPGRLGLGYPDPFQANSATQVLVRVAELAIRDPEQVSLQLDLERLRLDAAHELGAIPAGRSRKSVAKVTGTTPHGNVRKPSRDTIDMTATRFLRDALSAAKEANSTDMPRRADIARAVSNELDYRISVEVLFGTVARRGGRAYRYPEFMALWRCTMGARELARRHRENSSSGITGDVTGGGGSEDPEVV